MNVISKNKNLKWLEMNKLQTIANYNHSNFLNVYNIS